MLQLAAKSFSRAISATVFLAVLLPIAEGRAVITSQEQREPVKVSTRLDHLPPSYSDVSILRASFCDNCFADGDLLVCRQTFHDCFMQHPSSPLTDKLSLQDRSALITYCTQHISDTYGSSILCSGLQALQTCRTKHPLAKCAVFDRQMVIAAGITTQLIQTLRSLLREESQAKPRSRVIRYSPAVGQNIETKKTYFRGWKPLLNPKGSATVMNYSIDSRVNFTCDPVGHSSATNNSVVLNSEEQSESVEPLPRHWCVAFEQTGHFRLPAAVQIMIKGKELSRLEIIRRAVQKLRARPDFRTAFDQKITVKNMKGGKFNYLVTFRSCPFDEI